ncbi:MAG: hypothetical protein AAF208_02265 [Cyanobacteria bacterium P01_A01_bin.45]
MPTIKTVTCPVQITVEVRKNIYSGEVHFDGEVHLIFHHDITEAEEYYIRSTLMELISKYEGKGMYFVLVDMRELPKLGIMLTPLDKLDELYTYSRNQEVDSFLKIK